MSDIRGLHAAVQMNCMKIGLLAALLAGAVLAACGVDSTPQSGGAPAPAENPAKGEKKAE